MTKLNYVKTRAKTFFLSSLFVICAFPGLGFANSVNVKTNCGAVGNGTTDDTAAFNSCFTAVGANGDQIIVPAGTYLITSALTLPGGTWLVGDGQGVSTLWSRVSGGNLINIGGNNGKVSDLTLLWKGMGAAPASTVGVAFTYSSSTTPARVNFQIENLTTVGFYDNIYINGASNGILTNITTTNAEHDGIVGLQAQGYWTSILTEANKGDGIYLGPATGGGGVAPFMAGIQTFSNGGWGINTVSGIFIGGAESYLNNDSLGELLVNGGSSSDSGHIANVDVQFAGQNSFYPAPGYRNWPTAPGIHITASAGPIRITDVSLFGNNFHGLWLESFSAQVSNVRVLGSGVSGSGLCVLDSSGQSELTNVYCNTPSQITATNVIVRGCHFTGASATAPTLLISAGTNSIVADNLIYGGGTAPALSVSSGVTLARAYNIVIGSQVNAGTASGYYTPMFP